MGVCDLMMRFSAANQRRTSARSAVAFLLKPLRDGSTDSRTNARAETVSAIDSAGGALFGRSQTPLTGHLVLRLHRVRWPRR